LKILRCQAAKVESAIAEGGASRFRYYAFFVVLWTLGSGNCPL